MDSISKKFLLMDNLAKAMEPLDTRVQGMVQHSTSAIFLITLAGVFAKCQTWNEIADYGRIKIDFFRRFIPDLESTPSHDTFRRFFSIINPDRLESFYRGWACSLSVSNDSSTDSSASIKRHIAIDGKRMRSAGKENLSILSCIVNEINNTGNDDGKACVHIVSAYDVGNDISLGQERVPEKSNEITADKALIESLAIGEGDLVTMDAMGTQRDIAELIVKKGADYLFIVKENQPLLRKDIEETVGWNMMKKRESRNDEATIVDEKGHGYTVIRSCFTVQEKYMLGSMYRKWAGIKTFGVFNTIRKNKKTGEETKDTQYFFTSLEKNAAELIMHKRNHW